MEIIAKKKKWILAGIMPILLAAGLFAWFQYRDSGKSAEVQYDQTRVNRGDIVVGFGSDGTLGFSKVNLRFGVRGTVQEILVGEGSTVKKKDIIAILDNESYKDQYQLAQVKLSDAQQQEKDSKVQQLTSLLDDELRLKTMEGDLEKLRAEYQEMEQIAEAYSANEVKMKKLALENKELEYANALKKHALQKEKYQRTTSMEQNELAVKMAQEDLNDTVLYSPVEGTVLKFNKKVGESLTDEQDFAVVHENNTVKAVTKVIEYDIGQIKVGQKVNVSVEAVPDKKYTGEVSNIDRLPTTDSSGLVSYTVEILIKNPDNDLKDGMTCSVAFVQKEVLNCLIVPYKAIKIVDRKQIVTLLEQNGQMVEKEIKAGFTDGTNVEVLEGLKVNDTVVYPKKQVGTK